MLARALDLQGLRSKLARSPVVALLGARQVGKSTLARQVADELQAVEFFDLEHPADRARLEDPMHALQPLEGLVVLDEIQNTPDLFMVLRVLVDRPGSKTRFLVLGSASPDLLRQSAETLAGRIAFHYLDGFALDEVGVDALEALWLRGGFPRAFLAATDGESRDWREDFIQTFLERDLPQLGIPTPSNTLDRFWRMLAHYHGQTWNASELARAFGATSKTAEKYFDQLASALVVTRLPPWFENVGKRLVRSPKVYVRDTGILHALLGIETMRDLRGHPKIGASFEGFGLHQVIRRLGARASECFSWGTQAGAELDLVVVRGARRLGFEFKCTSAPRTTKSMHVAAADLGLERIDVVHLGDRTFDLRENIRALALCRVLADLAPLDTSPG